MRSLIALPVLAVVTLAACGGGGPPKTVEPRFQEIAAVHHSKCGGCHRRVEPGERTRGALSTALPRHKDRVKNLTDEQWALMLDYLADDASKPAGDAH